MTLVSEPSPSESSVTSSRQRGSVRRLRDRVQVRVSAGVDPVTGERVSLTESVVIERPGNERSERAAWKKAEKVRTRLLAEADELRVARTRSTVGALIEQWLQQCEVDPTTRMTYEGQIRNYILPTFGDTPLVLFAQDATARLETFYSRLRKCRSLCSGRRFVEKHVTDEDHNCVAAGCQHHVCKPYAASSIRSLHAILSGACAAAVRWGWLSFNPTHNARLPARRRPQPKPPTSAQMAKLIETAWRKASEWGLYVWLSAVLGARRGEVVALQWEDVDLKRRIVRLDENYVRGPDGMLFKDTKSHQMRRVSIDVATAELLRQRREESEARLVAIGSSLTGKSWVFSAKVDFSKPRDPGALTRRYGRLAAKLNINTTLKELRHYSATELLTAGVDLRTVAGRLGHGDGGTTTLRHYAAWVAEADSAAADAIGSRMPKSPPSAPDYAVRTDEADQYAVPTMAPVLPWPRPEPAVGRGSPYQDIADDLREQIRTGELQPGDELPTMAQLAVANTVAIGTAHRAVTALKNEGLVMVTRGRRAVVAANVIDTASGLITR